MPSNKFEKLLEELEALAKQAKGPKTSFEVDGVMATPSDGEVEEQGGEEDTSEGAEAVFGALLNKMSEIVPAGTGPDKPSMSSMAVAKPKETKVKVSKENALASAMMPVVAPITAWLVQVYPDDASVLHFQAKSVLAASYYLRWYLKVDAETWQKVQAVYLAAPATNKRGSFYGSSKQYLICSRKDETTITIPGYGDIHLPELFNITQ